MSAEQARALQGRRRAALVTGGAQGLSAAVALALEGCDSVSAADIRHV